MRRALIRYQVTPEYADRNQQRIEAVYRELAEAAPADLRYATFRLEDGTTFVHVVEQEPEGDSPLTQLAAFKEFRDGLDGNVVEPPTTSDADRVGAYRFLSA